MSAFLGPIHHWLFKKVLVVESRAFAIAEGLKEKHGEEFQTIIKDYGEKLEGQDLAELVGQNSIHTFLDGLIAKTDVFEAQLVKASEGDFDKILEIANAHGGQAAKSALAANGKDSATIDELPQYINDHQLEGMPCDPGAEFENNDGAVRYGHRTCNHMQKWNYTGVEGEKMCQVTNSWLTGFINGLNSDVNFKVVKTIAGGADACESHITA